MSVRGLALILALTACSAAQTAATPQRYQISGTVVHAITGQPLARAEVAIGITEDENVLQGTVTDEQGHFVFSNLKRAKYWMGARKRGFPRQGYQQHEDYSTGIAVGTGVSSEGIVFPLLPGASISGTVTNSEGEAVAEAQVLLFRRGLSYGRHRTILRDQERTDDLGRYHFNHLLPGSYFVAVSAQPWYKQVSFNGLRAKLSADVTPPRNSQLDVAYPVTFFPGVTDSDSAMPIPLKPGDRVSIDMVLSSVPSIHVRLRPADPEGNYAAFTQLLFGTFPITIPTQPSPLPSGEIEISGLTPGQFTANIQSFSGDSEFRSQAVTLTGDLEIDAARTPPRRLAGLVRLTTDPLTSGAEIRLWNLANDQPFDAEVNEKGEFGFSDAMTPGKYEVIILNMPNTQVARVSATGAEVTGTVVKISRIGDVHLTVDLTQGLARVEGTALKDGKPSPQTMILLVPDDFEHDPAAIRRDQSDSDGTFALRFALPGKYTVVAIPNGWDLEWQNPSVLKPYLEHGERLEVAAGQKYQVKVQVH